MKLLLVMCALWLTCCGRYVQGRQQGRGLHQAALLVCPQLIQMTAGHNDRTTTLHSDVVSKNLSLAHGTSVLRHL